MDARILTSLLASTIAIIHAPAASLGLFVQTPPEQSTPLLLSLGVGLIAVGVFRRRTR